MAAIRRPLSGGQMPFCVPTGRSDACRRFLAEPEKQLQDEQPLESDDLVPLIQPGKIGVSHAELTSPLDLRLFRRRLFDLDRRIIIDRSGREDLQKEQEISLLA